MERQVAWEGCVPGRAGVEPRMARIYTDEDGMAARRHEGVMIGLGAESEYQFESKCGKWYYAVIAVISGDLVVITDILADIGLG